MFGQRDAQRVVIAQDHVRMTVDATFAADTESGRADGWTISYRIPDDDGTHAAFSDAQPLDVIPAGGQPARFLAWRKVGRRRLGIGLGAPPRRG